MKEEGNADSGEWLAESLKGARVLVVDDDRLQRLQTMRLVAEWGAQGVGAHTAAEAIRQYRAERPDIVLLDVVMPDVDGYKLSKLLKADAEFVPIIMLTALDDVGAKRRGLAAGADEFLTKPVSPIDLKIRVSSMLRIRRLARDLEEANRRLEALAGVDPLTQLPNRRILKERLEQEFSRVVRYRRPLACLILDVDHFKRVNDDHGHLLGDEVLTHVGSTIASTIRRSDLAGRYGGEEFLVIAPETSSSGAAALGERLRHAIGSAPGGSLPRVTVSIGVATTDPTTQAAEDLLRSADRALYAAKEAGRNRVIVANETQR
ncbi:MAG TPA: diguanylate cyclase [Gaiellaceae bacterium]|jgi:diguanylate cyclase (GGDEF)-like protein|nr:diguanylate cyclase [Gaiellaceae bacterium]